MGSTLQEPAVWPAIAVSMMAAVTAPAIWQRQSVNRYQAGDKNALSKPTLLPPDHRWDYSTLFCEIGFYKSGAAFAVMAPILGV